MQFADGLSISKREFYTRIGVSRGTLEARTGITEDVLAKFIAEFPEISLEWLILGCGEMYRQGDNDLGILDKNMLAFIQSSQTQLVEQAELIGRLKERLSHYEKP